jgi:zinc-ribbon domain
MPYVCELGNGQTLYLENNGTQTLVTLASGGVGQQQQASSGYQTGTWTTQPQVYRTSQGVIVKITAQGEYNLLIQGSSMSLSKDSLPVDNSQPLPLKPTQMMPTSSMPPMKPMKPMQPLKMGDMEMNLNTMEMRMGDMELKMGSPTLKKPASNFCSQCGARVNQSDRFCANCGHALN